MLAHCGGGGDCRWGKLPKFYHISIWSVFIAIILDDAEVSCGGHTATNCGECPRGNGAQWCNGDCTWVIDQCVKRKLVELILRL